MSSGTTNTCTSSTCTSSFCTSTSKKPSQLGFLVAMFLVVALGGGAYLYLDTTVFGPVDAQEQTVLNNPGVGHPPKNKRQTSQTSTTARTGASAESNENQ